MCKANWDLVTAYEQETEEISVRSRVLSNWRAKPKVGSLYTALQKSTRASLRMYFKVKTRSGPWTLNNTQRRVSGHGKTPSILVPQPIL